VVIKFLEDKVNFLFSLILLEYLIQEILVMVSPILEVQMNYWAIMIISKQDHTMSVHGIELMIWWINRINNKFYIVKMKMFHKVWIKLNWNRIQQIHCKMSIKKIPMKTIMYTLTCNNCNRQQYILNQVIIKPFKV